MDQVTVFSGPERRRRWSEEERLQILSEAFAPGACVAEVCCRHDISSALIYTWRRKLLDAGAAQEAEGARGITDAGIRRSDVSAKFRAPVRLSDAV